MHCELEIICVFSHLTMRLPLNRATDVNSNQMTYGRKIDVLYDVVSFNVSFEQFKLSL